MILIYYANRAEKSILDPIKAELDRRSILNLYVDLSTVVNDIEEDANLSQVYDFVFDQVGLIGKVDCSIVIGDRREIMFASLALFIKGVPVVQLASGDMSEKISLVDDYFRHLITVLSSAQIGFTKKSKENSDKIMNSLNLENNSIFLPNPTLSDINFDKRKTKKEYDLILVHPQSLSLEGTKNDANEVLTYFKKDKKTIVIKGNKDKNYEVLYDVWDFIKKYENVEVYENLPKTEFIEVLSNCDRFITNSSCSFYEAPLFLEKEQIIHIGDRNKNRETASYTIEDIKSSGKIVDFIMREL